MRVNVYEFRVFDEKDDSIEDMVVVADNYSNALLEVTADMDRRTRRVISGAEIHHYVRITNAVIVANARLSAPKPKI